MSKALNWVIAAEALVFAALQLGPGVLAAGVVFVALFYWRRRALPVGLLCAVSVGMAFMGPIVPHGPTAAATSMGSAPVVQSGVRPLFADVPPGGYPHSSYTAGNCTWWAAYNRQIPPWPGEGDAWQWYPNAVRDGLPTAPFPSPGAIVVYRAGPAYSSHGHVAIVLAVGQGFYRASEMNFAGLDVIDERDAPWPDPQVEGFIPK